MATVTVNTTVLRKMIEGSHEASVVHAMFAAIENAERDERLGEWSAVRDRWSQLSLSTRGGFWDWLATHYKAPEAL
jgi:hypothetical protein